MTVYDGSMAVYPDFERGLNTNVLKFYKPIPMGESYEVIIMGY